MGSKLLIGGYIWDYMRVLGEGDARSLDHSSHKASKVRSGEGSLEYAQL